MPLIYGNPQHSIATLAAATGLGDWFGVAGPKMGTA
jgi:hypothetical protein